MFVIPPGTPHQTVADVQRPHWNLTICFDVGVLAPLGDVAIAHARAATADIRLVTAGTTAHRWESLVSDLTAECHRHGGPRELMLAAKVLEACLLLSAPGKAHGAGGDARGAGAQHVQRVLTYVEQHLSERLSLERVSRDIGLNPCYVSTLFHRIVGTSLFRHITSQRLQRARALLADGELTVDDIARRCGFGSTRTLYRCWRDTFGSTPGQARLVPGAEATVAWVGGATDLAGGG